MVIYVKFLYDVACQKLLKLANVSRSNSKNNTGTVFLRHSVDRHFLRHFPVQTFLLAACCYSWNCWPTFFENKKNV